MKRWELYASMREQGMTYREIAEKCGCSYQNVAMSLAKRNVNHFRHITESGCVYPVLRNWMNENRICVDELLRRIHGHNVGGHTHSRWSELLKGRTELKKHDIDSLLRVTGMTYEELFGEVSDG